MCREMSQERIESTLLHLNTLFHNIHERFKSTEEEVKYIKLDIDKHHFKSLAFDEIQKDIYECWSRVEADLDYMNEDDNDE